MKARKRPLYPSDGTKLHPLCENLPELCDDSLDRLKQDIVTSGWLDRYDIVMLGDEILDGRHRYIALEELYSETGDEQYNPKTHLTQYKNEQGSPEMFVGIENRVSNYRQLNSAQKACYAARLEEFFRSEVSNLTPEQKEEVPKKHWGSGYKGERRVRWAGYAAWKMGSNFKSIERASQILKLSPKRFKALEKGRPIDGGGVQRQYVYARHEAGLDVPEKIISKAYLFIDDDGKLRPIPRGQKLRGVSKRLDSEGNLIEEWVKTKEAGREPDDSSVVRLTAPVITKVSTQYDAEGKVMSQWVAEKPEAVARAKAWSDYAKVLTEDIKAIEPIAFEQSEQHDLMTVYPIGDHHFGMYSWAEETGADWDLEIAEQTFMNAISYLYDKSASRQALLAFLGDFMHYDNFSAVTPANKNLLDSDTRFPKLVRTAIRSMRYAIDQALKFHNQVHVIVEIGNHDPASSVFLAEVMKNIYELNARVTFDDSPAQYHYHRYGKVLIGTHHGHQRGAKPDKLPGIMASDVPEDWGATKYRYWFTGHIHHDKVSDFPGCRVESVRVLAPNDAWAHNMGYRSMRDMKAVLFDEDYGEVARNIINMDRLNAKPKE